MNLWNMRYGIRYWLDVAFNLIAGILVMVFFVLPLTALATCVKLPRRYGR